jgi:galactokinase
VRVTATAPGRVNLIGDHTDYTGGLVLPMAIDLRTVVTVERRGDVVHLTSLSELEPAMVALGVDAPADARPPWARYVAGVVAVLRPTTGAIGTVSGDLPVGAGLSSSAALEVAVALALGFEGTPVELARLCQAAEQQASGVPCGIMDQLAIAAGVAGHALLIDCRTEAVSPVPLPPEAAVHVIDTGPRTLATSAYATRRAECERAESLIGPLRDADEATVAAIADPVLRRRARHVVTENARVQAAAEALRVGDLATAGAAMLASHASLRDDFEVSTPALDETVERVRALPGVHGARVTGGGFGGSVVILAQSGASVPGLRVMATAAATVSTSP